jgi:hypothetical protein
VGGGKGGLDEGCAEGGGTVEEVGEVPWGPPAVPTVDELPPIMVRLFSLANSYKPPNC